MKELFFSVILLLSLSMLSSAEISESINQFGLDILQQSRAESENYIISPYSIYTALAMTAEGADNKTLEEMHKVLKIYDRDESIAMLSSLQERLLKSSSSNTEISIANALYLGDNFTVEAEFENSVKNNFAARIMLNDFNLSSINNWVKEKTKGKIPSILNELDPLSRLVILNAIYFKADWQNKFNVRQTKPEKFYLNSNEEVEVMMMEQTRRFPYYEEKNFQAMKMSYGKSNYSMLIILPALDVQLSDLIDKLESDSLNFWVQNMTDQRLNIKFPRFKIGFQQELSSILKVLGMRSAFHSKADFSRINQGIDLLIDQVQHRAFIEVDETGAEAAAATAVAMKMMCESIPPTPVDFHADHPFMFFIIDDTDNLLLFSGILNNPTLE